MLRFYVVYNVQCTIYSVHSTVRIIHFTQCTMYTVHRTICIVRSVRYSMYQRRILYRDRLWFICSVIFTFSMLNWNSTIVWTVFTHYPYINVLAIMIISLLSHYYDAQCAYNISLFMLYFLSIYKRIYFYFVVLYFAITQQTATYICSYELLHWGYIVYQS